MSIGLSILISAVIVSIVQLYLATKDRWNWRKLPRLLIRTFVGLLLLTVLLVVTLRVATWFSQRPKSVSGLWGINLAATKTDVRFLKGEPQWYSPDDRRWAYSTDSSIFVFRFDSRGFAVCISQSAQPVLTFASLVEEALARQLNMSNSDLDSIVEANMPSKEVGSKRDAADYLMSGTDYMMLSRIRDVMRAGLSVRNDADVLAQLKKGTHRSKVLASLFPKEIVESCRLVFEAKMSGGTSLRQIIGSSPPTEISKLELEPKQGFSFESTMRDLIDILGSPSDSVIRRESLSRVYCFPNLHFFCEVESASTRIVQISCYDPNAYAPDFELVDNGQVQFWRIK